MDLPRNTEERHRVITTRKNTRIHLGTTFESGKLDMKWKVPSPIKCEQTRYNYEKSKQFLRAGCSVNQIKGERKAQERRSSMDITDWDPALATSSPALIAVWSHSSLHSTDHYRLKNTIMTTIIHSVKNINYNHYWRKYSSLLLFTTRFVHQKTSITTIIEGNTAVCYSLQHHLYTKKHQLQPLLKEIQQFVTLYNTIRTPKNINYNHYWRKYSSLLLFTTPFLHQKTSITTIIEGNIALCYSLQHHSYTKKHQLQPLLKEIQHFVTLYNTILTPKNINYNHYWRKYSTLLLSTTPFVHQKTSITTIIEGNIALCYSLQHHSYTKKHQLQPLLKEI